MEYIIKAKIDSLVVGGICAYSGLKDNLVSDCSQICIIAVYGFTGLIVTEALKSLKSRLIS